MSSSTPFSLQSPLTPAGDQPQAIKELSLGLSKNLPYQALLGVTGSGKTMTMAHVIAKANKPALIMSHNKTLAAQLYGEIKGLFPDNAVEYFISYYDYYQPEAYMPTTDTYIAKDASINEDIDRLRLRSTASLMERSDVIIVATVSAIYGLGDPASYKQQMLLAETGAPLSRADVMKRLVEMQYKRNDIVLERGTFRVRGDVVDVLPAYEESAIRFEFFGSSLERVTKIDPLTGRTTTVLPRAAIYPAKHFVVAQPTVDKACVSILAELDQQYAKFIKEGKLLEAQRIKERTNHDVEMLRNTGTCQGIENYSRHLTGRNPGDRPSCLLDYFPSDYLVFLDESHVTLPQIGGMYAGDRSRKETLVQYGFRLPSAMDNRPLTGDEFKALVPQMIFVSATPGEKEMALSAGQVVEQIIRPTGLVDPEVEVRPVANQVDDLLEEIRIRVKKSERVLVTTLTKRSAEDLADYLEQAGVKVRYLHSDIVTLERVEIIRALRLGEFDVLVGINLLREGLDIPEVSLVAVLDADQEGFLRSDRSLIQTIGRAARNVEGRAILYADKMTDSMKRAISETNRRRERQQRHNKKHGITPTTITKSTDQIKLLTRVADAKNTASDAGKPARARTSDLQVAPEDKEAYIIQLKSAMETAAAQLDFETAALLRDQLFEIETGHLPSRAAPGRFKKRVK